MKTGTITAMMFASRKKTNREASHEPQPDLCLVSMLARVRFGLGGGRQPTGRERETVRDRRRMEEWTSAEPAPTTGGDSANGS